MLNQKLSLMKYSFLLISFLLVFSNCSTFDEEANKDEAAKAITGFYDAMIAFDYESMRTFCTDDFFAIEEGKTYNNLDEFLALVKTFEGAKMELDFKVQRAIMNVKSALLVVEFNGVAIMNDDKISIKAIENYSLVKENGKWLINFFHSTYLKEEDNIIGKWKFIKSVDKDEKESVFGYSIEHFYEDGTFTFNNLFFNKSVPINSYLDTPEQIKNLFDNYQGAYGTYEADVKTGKLMVKYIIHDNVEKIGERDTFLFELRKDTLIWYGKHYAIRVK